MTGEVVNIHKREMDDMLEALADVVEKVKNGEVDSLAYGLIMNDGTEIFGHDNSTEKRTQMIGTLHRLGMHIDRIV